VVVYISEKMRYIANLGDSKAILSQKGTLIFSTYDHKPDNSDELKRIKDLGGSFLVYLPIHS